MLNFFIQNFINNCYNLSITFSMEEKDLLPASIRSGANVNVYPEFSRIEDRVASLKDFCTVSTKRLLTQCLLKKCESKASRTQNLHAKHTTIQLVCNYTNTLLTNWILNPNRKVRHPCSWTVSIIKLFEFTHHLEPSEGK